MKKENTDRHIGLIVTRLEKLQRKDGSWAENNFINALIGYSLSEMRAPSEMLKSTANFIMSQKSPEWSWNYHPRDRHGTYPDDLDDTFCSLIALLKIKPETITADALSHTGKLLSPSTHNKGGPYFTWANGIWNDVDPVVNANIAFCHSLLRVEMPDITKYIDESLEKQETQSKYYDNPFLAYYFIARNYRGLKKNDLVRRIMNCMDEAKIRSTGIFLAEIALAASALSRLHAPFHITGRLIKKMKGMLDSDFAAHEETPLYIEKIIGGTKCHARSTAFTLAACGEALSLHQKETDLLTKIGTTAHRRCGSLTEPLRSEALRLVEKTFASDSFRDILLMPYRIVSSSEYSAYAAHETADYGLIGLYGWLAYALYDRIIDGKEQPRLLPLANVFHREAIIACGQCAGPKNQKLCQKVFDAIDRAEMLENRHRIARGRPTAIPSKKQIADKSIGLILPSMLALIRGGMPPGGPKMKRFVRLFRSYIFVRQMSDDIRDREEDLARGIVTRVSGRIKNGSVVSAREIVACHEKEKMFLKKAGTGSGELFLLGLIEEYAATARIFLDKSK